MPFIFIDNGSPSIRHYQAPKQDGVSPVVKSNATQPINNQTQKDLANYEQASGKRKEQAPQRVQWAREIMSQPVIYLDETDLSIKNAQYLIQHHGISHLPICRKKKLVAITTEIQILRHTVNQQQDWYHQRVFAAKPETDIHQLAHVMFDEHVGCLPIVDDDQILIGLVTRSDLLRVTSQYGPLEFWA